MKVHAYRSGVDVACYFSTMAAVRNAVRRLIRHGWCVKIMRHPYPCIAHHYAIAYGCAGGRCSA